MLCIGILIVGFSSVQFSCSAVSNCLRLHESQHARPPCPSPTPGVHSNSCPSNWWWHPAISSSVVPFSSCPQSLPASGSFPMSQLFAWGGQSIGSASVLPMNIQGWFHLGLIGLISLHVTHATPPPPFQISQMTSHCLKVNSKFLNMILKSWHKFVLSYLTKLYSLWGF